MIRRVNTDVGKSTKICLLCFVRVDGGEEWLRVEGFKQFIREPGRKKLELEATYFETTCKCRQEL